MRALTTERGRFAGRVVLFVALSAMTAVAFGLIVYFAGTSVAWFATSPTSDPLFGRLNECLMRRLPKGRAGFAVSADGQAAVAFDGTGAALCRVAPDAASEQDAALTWLRLEGISSAAWDLSGTLWLATSPTGAAGGGLWRATAGEAPVRAGDLAAVALAGHRRGVVALDASGRLVSLGSDGSALAYAEHPRPPPDRVQLVADSGGEHVALVAAGKVAVFTAAELERAPVESPCRVQFLWWLPQPGEALVTCDADESWALTLSAKGRRADAAPKRERERSVLIPLAGAYLRDCDTLPCEARAP